MPDSKKFEHPMYGLSNEESHRLTIESIEEALLLLVKQKPLSRLSVTDIVKKAGVSRAAFYRNYSSKEDVLRSISLRHAREMYGQMRRFRDDPDRSHYWSRLFSYAREHADFYPLIAENASASLISECTEYIVTQMSDHPRNSSHYVTSYMIGAVSRVFEDWIKGGMKESPEEMADFLKEFTRGDGAKEGTPISVRPAPFRQ